MVPSPRTDHTRTALATVGSLLLGGTALWMAGPAAVLAAIGDASWLPVALTAALVPAQVGLAAWRWRWVGRALDCDPGPGAWREVALAQALNQVLPGGIAGDAVRAWRSSRGGENGVADVVSGVVLERWAGQLTGALVAVLGLALWQRIHFTPAPALAWAVVLVTALALSSVLVVPPQVPWVGHLGARARRLAGHPARWPVLGASAVLMVSFLLALVVCAEALGRPLGLGALTAGPLLLLAMAVPLSVGGWGPRELVAAMVLPTLGWTPAEAVALSTLYGVGGLLGALPGLLVLADRPSVD